MICLSRALAFGETMPAGRLVFNQPLTLTDQTLRGIGPETILDFSQLEGLALGQECLTLQGASEISNLRVIGPGGDNGVIRFLDSVGGRLENVSAEGGGHSVIAVRGGSDVEIVGGRVNELTGTLGYGYGLALEGCTDVQVRGGSYHALRHGVTMGNDPRGGGIHANGCHVSNARISSSSIYGADMHELTSGNTYEHCRIEHGSVIGGSGNRVLDCVIEAAPTGEAILLAGLDTLDVEIDGCELSGNAQARGLVFYDEATYEPAAGTIRMVNNKIAASAGCPTFLRLRWAVDGRIVWIGNEFSSANSVPVRTRILAPATAWLRMDRFNNIYDTSPDLVSLTTDNADGDVTIP